MSADAVDEPVARAAERIVQWLQGAPRSALFATEIDAQLRAAGCVGTLDEALSALARERSVVVVDHPAPDVHLRDVDRRTVALAAPATSAAECDARVAAEQIWNEWLRAFLASHRCA